MYRRPFTGSIDRNSLSRKLQKPESSKNSQSELIAATIGWPQARVADAPEPTTWQAVTDRAFSGTKKGMKILLRSEEHTSELQSPYDLVCRLLLEKKKKKKK